MKIKVEPFLMKKGNRLGKAAIEFDSTETPLGGFQLVGFTICEDDKKGLFVLFPSAPAGVMTASDTDNNNNSSNKKRLFFFLRPTSSDLLDKLESSILDAYESLTTKVN